MATTLEFKFDPNQDYQLEAIESVVQVFEGLPRHDSGFALGDNFVPNLPSYETLEESWLYSNVRAVQDENDPDRRQLDRSMQLDVDEGLELKGVSNDSWRYPSFTTEMETGTGKTYVYLRTIHELRKHYGFRKFIIVVPSVAIYEGAVKNFEVTKSHFAALYGNETVNLIQYDSSRLSDLRTFATSSFVEILVMTIQSFRLQRNRIYRPSEQLPGELLPYEYIQKTRPILILDEPQSNMETERGRSSLRTLHPLFALRYSATHRRTPNHLYCLTPFEAYRRGLVKKIQVDAVTERNNFNQPFLALESISTSKGISATVRTYLSDEARTYEGTVTLKQGDNLHAKTEREEHKGGYVVEEIHAGEGFLKFSNGITLRLDEPIGPTRPEIFRVQIERTVLKHMERQSALLDEGIKVLSLFFIDRVANYVERDGIIRRLFDQAFEKFKDGFPSFQDLEAHQVREGYFAQRVKRGEIQYIDTTRRTKSEREAEKAAYELIMQKKELLLSFEEPVSFVFAHSALKEGWDNPNVFQICTLNQTVSKMKKRQEIGRGLRLPVDQNGERSFDDQINILTVVANESYESYAANLQNEYVEDGHTNPPPKPTRAGEATAYRNDRLFANALFRRFWQKLIRGTGYRINVDTPVLIEECVERLNNIRFPKPVIVVEQGEYIVTKFTVAFEDIRGEEAKVRVRSVDTRDNEADLAFWYEEGRATSLSTALNEPRLRGFTIDSIVAAGDNSKVIFKNDVELSLGQSYTFQTQEGQNPRREQVSTPDDTYPVFNLIDRAARVTNLTRPTLNTIFHRLRGEQKAMLPKNPEGFASTFISQVREALADHIVERIEFVLADEKTPYELSEMFPPSKEFPQQELVPANQNGLYDQMQTDSDVEKHFVRAELNQDSEMIAYFKFPPAFKIPFPKIIGDYNPDWGIVRRDDDGRTILELVRETKGTQELERLRFPHEKRKVEAAMRHFKEIGIDYRVTDGKGPTWKQPGDAIPPQLSFDSKRTSENG
ncbi:MAG: DEAD/DEAH box helicase family protein [bacterium]